MKRLMPLAPLLMLMLAAPPALAHKLKVFAAAEGAAITGTAYFAGGGKAAQSAGRLLGADGAVVAEFRTDADGHFRLSVPLRQDYRVAVDSGDGHVAEALVRADELPPSLPTPAASATLPDPAALVEVPDPAPAPTSIDSPPLAAEAIEAAVARQILPLRQQIDAMEDRARFSDIMGGVGSIFGLFGIWAWVAARRGRRP